MEAKAASLACISQKTLNEPETDVAGQTLVDCVQLDDRPFVAHSVVLDAGQPSYLPPLDIHVQKIRWKQRAKGKSEQRKNADLARSDGQSEGLDAAITVACQVCLARQVAQRRKVRETRCSNPPRALRIPSRAGDHPMALRTGWCRRPLPSPGSAYSAAIVAMRR